LVLSSSKVTPKEDKVNFI